MRNCRVRFLLPLLCLFIPLSASADFFLHSWEEHFRDPGFWDFKFEGNLYLFSSNFNADGTSTSPSGLGSYLRNQNDITTTLGLFPRFSVYGRFSWAYINQTGTVRPGNGFGLADQSIGAHYQFLTLNVGNNLNSRQATLGLQLQVDFPGYDLTSSVKNGAPDLGDGTVDFTSGLFALIPFHSPEEEGVNLRFGAGYTVRTAGYSSAIPWSARAEYAQAKESGFIGQFGFGGIYSLQTDLSGTAGRVAANQGSGGSFLTGAVNPTLLQVQGKMGYQSATQLQLFISAIQSLWGQVAPGGFQISFGLQKTFGAPPLPAIKMTPEQYGKSNSGYLNYSLDARVVKVNDRLHVFKIDKGTQDGVAVRQIFDIFKLRGNSSIGEAVARAQVTHVKLDESALEITEFFKEGWIEEGFTARRLIQ